MSPFPKIILPSLYICITEDVFRFSDYFRPLKLSLRHQEGRVYPILCLELFSVIAPVILVFGVHFFIELSPEFLTSELAYVP